MNKALDIQTSKGICSVHIGQDLLDHIPTWITPQKTMILADEMLLTKANHLHSLLLQAGFSSSVCAIPVKETSKSFENIYPLYTKMLQAGLDRNSVLFALGGGVIGDIAGFLAGTFLRGIPWVNIPSTLLAQVDSAVGGKTGINHQSGKNLIGVFHPPKLVVCDLSLLQTLPLRDMVSGLGEMIKYALIEDESFFVWIQQNMSSLLEKDAVAILHAVKTCLDKKRLYIEQDESDRLGIREKLNFGHTFGHAIESATEYSVFRHGEAVIWGMRAAIYLSYQKGLLSPSIFHHIDSFLKTIQVPNLPFSIQEESILQAIWQDKKKDNTGVRFILLTQIGKTVIRNDVPSELLKDTIRHLKSDPVTRVA